MASKEERDARLDELAAETQKWAAARRKRLQDQVSLSRRILKGRTGEERLVDAPVQSVSALAVDEINQFLTG